MEESDGRNLTCPEQQRAHVHLLSTEITASDGDAPQCQGKRDDVPQGHAVESLDKEDEEPSESSACQLHPEESTCLAQATIPLQFSFLLLRGVAVPWHEVGVPLMVPPPAGKCSPECIGIGNSRTSRVSASVIGGLESAPSAALPRSAPSRIGSRCRSTTAASTRSASALARVRRRGPSHVRRRFRVTPPAAARRASAQRRSR
jgi:hypothetical protein